MGLAFFPSHPDELMLAWGAIWWFTIAQHQWIN